MYDTYWGLKEPPFSLTPDPRFLYLSKGHEEALMLLRHSLASEGVAALTGQAGVGKSSLARKLLQWFDPKTFEPVLLMSTAINRSGASGEFAAWWGIGRSTDSLRAVVSKLQSLRQSGRRAVVVVEDSHLIKNPDAIDELCRVHRSALSQGVGFGLLFIGEPELDDALKHAAAGCDIALRSNLPALDAENTGLLLDFRLRVAGYRDEALPFSAGATFEIFKYSGGVPRLICQAADNALLVGCMRRATLIDDRLLEAVLGAGGGDVSGCPNDTPPKTRNSRTEENKYVA
jgi:general secretion pathway protein A